MEIIILTAIAAFIAGTMYATIGEAKSDSPQKANTKPAFIRPRPKPPEKPLDEQFLEASQSCFYRTKNLLNNKERSVYWSLVRLLSQNYCINPQASLGEVLTCKNELGHRAINSKRSDFVITDKYFNPVAVIEYQGSGHRQGNYEIRDATKRQALNRAGVDYIQLSETSDSYIMQTLKEFDLEINRNTKHNN